jgi:hypothetical protein
MDRVEPIRTQFLTETVELKKEVSKVLSALPKREVPKLEIELPRRQKPRIETPDPSDAQSRIDRELDISP